MDKRIEQLIERYFDKKISEEEAKELNSWIIQGNKDIFYEYVKIHFSVEQLKLTENIKGASWDKISSKINTKKTTKLIPLYKRSIFKYAAALLVLVSTGYFFITKDTMVDDRLPIVINNSIEIGTDKAVLTLEDGTDISLKKGQTYTSSAAESNGKELVYKPSIDPSISEIEYNYLTIPRGGLYQVKLSDGTKVWLNSESKLKYPKTFLDNQERVVELVYGEAYFDVSPSTNHHGAAFKVMHNKQDIEVLGTEFNIKAYRDESNVYTTLVEGKISISNSHEQQILHPNEQAIVNDVNQNISKNHIDVKSEIAWVNGEFYLKHKTLKEIMKVLARWYNMEVVFSNKELENVRFIGVLDRDQQITDILDNIKHVGVITNYEIHDKKIILK